ncbi:MAG: hypothetical protein ACR2G2_11845 [Pseudonocardia sp.]
MFRLGALACFRGVLGRRQVDVPQARVRTLPGVQASAPDTTEDTVDGQRALRLHARIAVIAFMLCVFVTGVFYWLGSVPFAVMFAGIGVLTLAILGWALYRKRRGAQRVQV